MTRWGFTLSRRWLGYLALVVAFAVACTLLSVWQLSRREEARAEIDRVEANWDSEPLPLAEVLPSLDAFESDQKWTPVVVTGRYLESEQLLARGRPLGGSPGFAVVVPFELEDGTVFVVDRGWVPVGNEQDAPDTVPAPPSGPVTITVRLKPGEPVLAGRSAPAGQIASINLPLVAELVGEPTYIGAYGLLDSEDPAPATRPIAAVRPTPDEGPHLSYAFQWLVFGLMAFIALAWAIRQEYRLRNEDDPAEQERAAARARRQAARRPSDAEVEDQLMDSHR